MTAVKTRSRHLSTFDVGMRLHEFDRRETRHNNEIDGRTDVTERLKRTAQCLRGLRRRTEDGSLDSAKAEQ